MAKVGALELLENLLGIWCTCFLSSQLHSFFFTTKTAHPRPQKCGVLASGAAALQLSSPAPALSRGSAQGQGPRERQGCGQRIRMRVAQKFSRYPGSRIPDTLESSSKGRAPFQSQAGSWAQEERREQGRSSHLPGSPEVPRLQRDFAGCFQFSFFLLGVLEALANNLPPVPPPPPAKLALSAQTPNEHTGDYCFFNPRLCAFRCAFSCIPLSSRNFLLSSLLFLSFSLFFKIREQCGRRTLAAARFLLSNVPL